MSFLLLLFVLKIIVSIFFIVVPFTQAKPKAMHKLTTLEGPSPVMFHLYVMAIGALLISYGFGAYHAYQHDFLTSSVWVGIVSNGGASAILIAEYLRNRRGEIHAEVANLKAIIVFGGIFIGFVFSAIYPSTAIAPL